MSRSSLTTQIAADLASGSDITAAELRGVLNNLLGEATLRTETFAVFTTVAAMQAATYLTTGQMVYVLGREAVDDGGAAYWTINAGTTNDGYTTLALSNGTQFARLAKQSVYDVRMAGCMASKTGTVNRAAILSLATFVEANGGGEIYFREPITCNNLVMPYFRQEGATHFYFNEWSRIIPGNPAPGTFVWEFPALAGNPLVGQQTQQSHYEIEGFRVRPNTVTVTATPFAAGKTGSPAVPTITGGSFALNRIDASNFQWAETTTLSLTPGTYDVAFTVAGSAAEVSLQGAAGGFVGSFITTPTGTGAKTAELKVTTAGTVRVRWSAAANGTTTTVSAISVKKPRAACNGLKFNLVNYLYAKNLRAEFIDGIAFEINGIYNSHIDLTTFECGNFEDNLPSVLICGNPEGGPVIATVPQGDFTNDLVISGTSEEDYLGWRLDGVVILRTPEALKIHGSDHTRRALHINQCKDFEIDVKLTNSWIGDGGFVLITDATNNSGVTTLRPFLSIQNETNGLLRVESMYNRRYLGTATNPSYIVVDLGDAQSALRLEGMLDMRGTGGTPFVDLEIKNNTPTNIPIDYSRLWWHNQHATDGTVSQMVLDNRSAEVRATNRFLNPLHSMRKGTTALPTFTEADLSSGVLNVTGYDLVVFSPTVATNLTGFVNEIGRRCTVIAGNGNATVVNGTNLLLAGSANWVMATNDTLSVVQRTATVALETGRSDRG